MKLSFSNLFPIAAVCGFALSAQGQTTIIDENFDPGYNRTVQNIAGGNMAVYRSRSTDVAGVAPGALSFSAAATAGADQFFNYFTDPGANVGPYVNNGHVVLGVGDRLTAYTSFSLSAVPATTAYSLRWGLFDDAGTRQTADLNSGGNSAAFTNNPGYALFVPLTSMAALNNQLSIRQRTTLTAGNIFSAGADFTQIGSTVGGAYNPMSSFTNFTLIFDVFRQDASTTILTATLQETISGFVITSGSVANTGTQLSSFSWMAWRPPQQPDINNGGTITFSDMQVVVNVPEPTTLTLLGLGALGLFGFHRRNRR